MMAAQADEIRFSERDPVSESSSVKTDLEMS